MTELDNLHLESFVENLQTRFLAQLDEANAVELEMVSATDTGSGPGREQFAIVFRGPLEAFLAQRMYRLEHPQMGALDLFLVPIKRDEDGFYYEACFARMV